MKGTAEAFTFANNKKLPCKQSRFNVSLFFHHAKFKGKNG